MNVMSHTFLLKVSLSFSRLNVRNKCHGNRLEVNSPTNEGGTLLNLFAFTENAGIECGRSRVQSPVKDRVIPRTLKKWYQ